MGPERLGLVLGERCGAAPGTVQDTLEAESRDPCASRRLPEGRERRAGPRWGPKPGSVPRLTGPPTLVTHLQNREAK